MVVHCSVSKLENLQFNEDLRFVFAGANGADPVNPHQTADMAFANIEPGLLEDIVFKA